jgi:dephospho-CoA kinase
LKTEHIHIYRKQEREDMKMKIALFGKMRAGKDTVADILAEEYGFEKFAFAQGIGEIIVKYFPTALSYGKPRKHYQHIGQSMRELDNDVWITYLLKRVLHYKMDLKLSVENKNNKKPFRVVVTDGRQLNEADRLRKEGYLIVKVEAPKETRFKRSLASRDIFTEEALEHETEKQVDLVRPDITIVNDGSIEDLRRKVKDLMDSGVLCDE